MEPGFLQGHLERIWVVVSWDGVNPHILKVSCNLREAEEFLAQLKERDPALWGNVELQTLKYSPE